MNISNKEALVYQVIQDNPGCQNNDADLIAAVWRHEGWNDNDSLENNIAKVTRSETITRRRRQIHEKGLIKYSTEADEQRTEAYINERDSAIAGAIPWWA